MDVLLAYKSVRDAAPTAACYIDRIPCSVYYDVPRRSFFFLAVRLHGELLMLRGG